MSITIYRGIKNIIELSPIDSLVAGAYGNGPLSNLLIESNTYTVGLPINWALSNNPIYNSGWKLTITSTESNQTDSYGAILIIADEIEPILINVTFKDYTEGTIIEKEASVPEFEYTNKSNLRELQTASQMSNDDLLRNYIHRVAADGSTDIGALEYLYNIALNSSVFGYPSRTTEVVTASDTVQHLLVQCQPNQRIIVFDTLLSLNDVTVISLNDINSVDLLAKMYAPNAGQGNVMNSVRGKHLPRGKSLYVQSSAAISYSIDCSYAIIEDEA